MPRHALEKEGQAAEAVHLKLFAAPGDQALLQRDGHQQLKHEHPNAAHEQRLQPLRPHGLRAQPVRRLRVGAAVAFGTEGRERKTIKNVSRQPTTNVPAGLGMHLKSVRLVSLASLNRFVYKGLLGMTDAPEILAITQKRRAHGTLNIRKHVADADVHSVGAEIIWGLLERDGSKTNSIFFWPFLKLAGGNSWRRGAPRPGRAVKNEKKRFYSKGSEQCIKRVFFRPAMPSSSRVPSILSPPPAQRIFLPEQTNFI